MSEPTDLPERIQRDLEDALRQGGADKLPNRPRPRPRSFRVRFPDLRPRHPGQLMLFGVILLVAMYLLPVPFRSQIVLFSVLCIGVSIATYFMHPHGQRPRYWRGNPMQLPASNWQEQLYRLIYRQG